MAQRIKKILPWIMGLLMLASPALVMGAGTWSGITYICNNGAAGECTFQDVVDATLGLVNWATLFALSFSVIVIAYAGFNYMISGDNPGKRREANKMLRKVAIGIAFMLGAWLIVKMITEALGVSTGISNLG